MLLLNVERLNAFFDANGKLFQVAIPLFEKRFCPFEDIFLGNLMSLAVRLRLYKELDDFATNRSERDLGCGYF